MSEDTTARAREIIAAVIDRDCGWRNEHSPFQRSFCCGTLGPEKMVEYIVQALESAGITLAGPGQQGTVWTVDYIGDGEWRGQSWGIGVFATEDEAFEAIRQVQRECRGIWDARDFLVSRYEMGAVALPSICRPIAPGAATEGE